MLFTTPLVVIFIPSCDVLFISVTPISEPTKPATTIPPSLELSISISPFEVSILPVVATSNSLSPLLLTKILPIASPICLIKPATVNLAPLFSTSISPPWVFVTFPVSVIVKSPSLLVIFVSSFTFVTLPEIRVPSLLSFVILIFPFSSFTVPEISKAPSLELYTLISPSFASTIPEIEALSSPLFVISKLPLLSTTFPEISSPPFVL